MSGAAGRLRPMPGKSDTSGRSRSASGGSRPRQRPPLPSSPHHAPDPRTELRRVLGPERGRSAVRRFDNAAKAFRAERFKEALPLLTRLVRDAPEIADVRELYGLVLYRLGRFKDAMRELEYFRELSGVGGAAPGAGRLPPRAGPLGRRRRPVEGARRGVAVGGAGHRGPHRPGRRQGR